MKEKKSKFKENIALFRKAWKVPKYKAAIKLGLYLIFIFIVVLFVRFCNTGDINSNQVITKLTTAQKLEKMNNYEYIININGNQNITTLEGIKYQDINDFEIINTKEKYTVSDNNIYKKGTTEYNNQLLNINLNSLFIDNLKNYVTEETLKNEIEYQGNEIKKEYHIYNFNITENIIADKYIVLTIYENDSYIYKIEIDATEYMKTINSNINNYNISIEYNNINEIKDYKSN